MYLIDYLTCGRCQAEFPLGSIVAFMEHKKSDCRVFLAYQQSSTEKNTELYSCYNCPKKFNAAVSLLQHAQYQHSQKIFKELTNQQAELASPSSETQEKDTSNNSTAGRSRGGNTADYSTSSEPLEKCCAAIVPKKRKRHIETKHKNWSKTYLKYHQSNNILIDLESNTVESDSYQDNGSENGAILLQPGNMYEFGLSNRPSNKIVGISYMNSSEAVNAEPISLPQYQCLSFGLQKKDKDDTSQVKVKSPQENDKSLVKRSSSSKPFKCDTCGHTFNQRIHLKKHLSKHTGVKPYKCEQCDYSTVERSHLKVHIRIHTGEKPFKCNHCEYATAQNSTLKIHLKRHHGSLFLECTHCGKSFPEKTELYEHRKEHGDVINQCIETKPVVPDS